MTFSGSYLEEDVTFLLKPVRLAPTDVAQKERLIQSGARHYSEMISREEPPDTTYVRLFHEAITRNGSLFAADILRLARHLADQPADPLVLVSLARAGTPIGVLLKRTLERMGRRSHHYSISIIRDRGIDFVALDYILSRHPASAVYFVDGWTGKGAIADELTTTIADYNASRRVALRDSLFVVVDLAGVAHFAGSAHDYLIPCAILNAVVSGLVSRTILNDDCVQEGDFHACLYYEEYRDMDLSQWFANTMMQYVDRERGRATSRHSHNWTAARRKQLRAATNRFVDDAMRRYEVRDRNRVKPGVGEATRALLRRMPDRLLLREPSAADVAHLHWLAARRGISIEPAAWIPYEAAAIIRALGNES